MRIFSLVISTFAFAILSVMPMVPLNAAQSEQIAVVVNDGIISKSDVDERVKMIMVTSGMPDTKELRAQILPQVISGLIDEQLKLQEAEKYKIEVAPPEIELGLATVAEQNKMDPVKFTEIVKRSGVSIESLKSQIKSQIAWTKVVQQRLRSKVTVMDSDVDVWLERFNASLGKNEYLASEIFLPVEDRKAEMQARELAAKLITDMRSGEVPFFKVAQQFSQSAGAARGGDMGWVQEGQLSAELDTTLKNLEKGQLSEPVRALSGIHILLLRDKRMISDEYKPESQEIRNMIGLQRLDRLQQRYLMDLKSSAFIENRFEQESES